MVYIGRCVFTELLLVVSSAMMGRTKAALVGLRLRQGYGGDAV
jgi:hypothetical protein